MCCWENQCEFTWDIILVVLGLATAVAGVSIGTKGFLEGNSCCDGWGSGAARVLGNLEILAGLLFVVVPSFTVICTVVLIQSFFHTGRFRIPQLDCLTTSAGLRGLQLLSHLLFFMGLFLSQLLLCWVIGTSVLGHLCGNQLMRQPAQVLVTGLSRSPSDIFQSFFEDAAELPFLTLSLREAMKGLNLNSYCNNSPNADQYLHDIWLGSFLLMLSQSFMAIALRGEKQRVGVHELNEDEYGLAGEAVTGLLKNPSAVAGAASLVGGPLAGALAGAAASAADRMGNSGTSRSGFWPMRT